MDYDAIRSWPFPRVRTTYDERDAILYALGIGYGSDPLDAAQLPYVYEDGLRASPAMAAVLAHPGQWMSDPATGIDFSRVVHAEQSVRWHAPLPPTGSVEATTAVTAIVDKGPRTGALVYQRRTLVDRNEGTELATVEQVNLCRADGGLARSDPAPPRPPAPPDRPPDRVVTLATIPQAALVYRLSGDRNPLHADPEVAAAAGFPRPIAHGLLTYGLAVRAVVAALADGDPARLRKVGVRFSAPVYPGETVAFELWSTSGSASVFQARVIERDVLALVAGVAEVA